MNNRDGFISQYISLCVGAILYGAFLISILRSLQAFIRQGRGKWGLHVVAAMLFVLVTLDISLLIVRLGSTVLHCYMCGPAQDGNCDPIPWFNRVRAFIVAFSALLTEGVMIYRCWVLHSHRWIAIVVPSLLWIQGFGMVIYVTASVQNNFGGNLEQEVVGPAVQIGFWVLIIVLNFMTTGLIVRQVLIQKEKCTQIEEAYQKTYLTTPHNSIVRSIVESGLMGIVASSFVLASQFCRSISLLASTVMIMISGISYNLISIRVDQQRRKKEKKECRLLAEASCMTHSTLSFSNRSLLVPPNLHLKS